MKMMKKKYFYILVIMLCVPLLIHATFSVNELKNEINRKNIVKETEKITITYLKEKYPERQFEIKSINVDECYNGFVFSGWDNRTNVIIEDNTGEYKVYVDIDKSKSLNENVCFDDVETESIKSAMTQKIQKITGLKSDVIEYNFDFDCPVDKWFNQKFEGNITSFLQKENAQRLVFEEDELNLDLYCTYLNGTENFKIDKDDEEFLQILDVVVLIDFSEELPEPIQDDYLFYAFEDINSIKNSILERDITINSLYEYDKTKNKFENILNN
jgi:hypothetical protein